LGVRFIEALLVSRGDVFVAASSQIVALPTKGPKILLQLVQRPLLGEHPGLDGVEHRDGR
jgi:hypothetical protein